MSNVGTSLNPVNEPAELSGFTNIFKREISEWSRFRSWFITLVVWIGIINGIMATAMITEKAQGGQPLRLMTTGIDVMTVLIGIFTSIHVVIKTQDAIIGEKQTGTAAWIMSKPVSRSAFLISKFVATAVGAFFTMLIAQCIAAYVEIRIIVGQAPELWRILAGGGVLFFGFLFFISLTIMLGVLFNSRGPVIGIPLVLILGSDMFISLIPELRDLMPWGIPGAVKTFILGGPLEPFLPIIATPIWTVVFLAVSIWAFNRTDL